jgi:hypothetical protein
MKNYNIKKEETRQKAIKWQQNNQNLSYYDLMIAGDYFEKLGKKYGLLKEFKENGII